MMLFISNTFILLSILIIICGMIGLLRSRGFYHRLIYIALVDTIGTLFLLIGLACRQADLWSALKFLFLVIVINMTAPIISHKLGRSAYQSMHREGVSNIDE